MIALPQQWVKKEERGGQQLMAQGTLSVFLLQQAFVNEQDEGGLLIRLPYISSLEKEVKQGGDSHERGFLWMVRMSELDSPQRQLKLPPSFHMAERVLPGHTGLLLGDIFLHFLGQRSLSTAVDRKSLPLL